LHARNLQPELMDDPALPAEEHRRALAGLARLNAFSNSVGVLWPAVRGLARELGRSVKILDVATGGGDVPLGLCARAKRAGVKLELHACDLSPVALETAAARTRAAGATVHYFPADALDEALPTGFDIVTCSLFLHHLLDDDAVILLARLAAATDRLVLVNDLMSDLLAYAFLCDVTRVASYHMLSVASEVQLGEIGHSTTQHGDSHAGDENYHDGIVFIMTRIADLMRKLRDTEDVDGTNLLDSSIIFGSTEVTQGWTHSWQRQPIILGGHGRGHLVHPGIHYQATPQTSPTDDFTSAGNTSDILLTLLRAFDADAESIGSGAPMSFDVLPEIMA